MQDFDCSLHVQQLVQSLGPVSYLSLKARACCAPFGVCTISDDYDATDIHIEAAAQCFVPLMCTYTWSSENLSSCSDVCYKQHSISKAAEPHRKLAAGRLLKWFRCLAHQRLPLGVQPTHDRYEQQFSRVPMSHSSTKLCLCDPLPRPTAS